MADYAGRNGEDVAISGPPHQSANPLVHQSIDPTGPSVPRKVFIDCGCREGDATAVFLGDETVNGGSYSGYLKSRNDAGTYELIAFESADYKFLSEVRERFKGSSFTSIERLVWIKDGMAQFSSDGESDACSLVEAARASLEFPVKSLPCLDRSRFLRDNFSPSDSLVMKMDIEGAEFAVLDKLIADGTINLLQELYVEYHRVENCDPEMRKTESELKLKSIPSLYYRNDWP